MSKKLRTRLAKIRFIKKDMTRATSDIPSEVRNPFRSEDDDDDDDSFITLFFFATTLFFFLLLIICCVEYKELTVYHQNRLHPLQRFMKELKKIIS